MLFSLQKIVFGGKEKSKKHDDSKKNDGGFVLYSFMCSLWVLETQGKLRHWAISLLVSFLIKPPHCLWLIWIYMAIQSYMKLSGHGCGCLFWNHLRYNFRTSLSFVFYNNALCWIKIIHWVRSPESDQSNPTWSTKHWIEIPFVFGGIWNWIWKNSH